jgi:RHS repeat-associated protein
MSLRSFCSFVAIALTIVALFLIGNEVKPNSVAIGASVSAGPCGTTTPPQTDTPSPSPTSPQSTAASPSPTGSVGPTTSPTPAIGAAIVSPGQPVTIQDSTGEVGVSFTGDETNERLRIDLQPATPCDPQADGRYTINQFKLSAFAIDRANAIVRTFLAPVQLDIHLTDNQLIPFAPDSLALQYHNESAGTWDPVTASVDFAGGSVHAELSHFSEFRTSATSNVILPRPLESSQVQIQSGAATASIPIELPKGPGGIVPDLSFFYASSAVDEMKSRQSMTSWVGAGWNVAVPSIARDAFNGRYYLGMQGVSSLIIRENAATTCPAGLTGTEQCFNWHAQSDQYLQIISKQCGSDLNPDVYHIFYVWTKDGTQYEFGDNGGNAACTTADPGTTGFPSSLQLFTIYRTDLSPAWRQYHYRMDVSRITDTNGNRIDFTYNQDIENNCPSGASPACKLYVRAAYPLQIDWGANSPSGTHLFKLTFNQSASWQVGSLCGSSLGSVRRDSPVLGGTSDGSGCAPPPTPLCSLYPGTPNVMETRQLDSIVIQDESGVHTIREYDLTHASSTDRTYDNNCPISGDLKLDTIVRKGTDGNSLRTMTFGYSDYPIRYWDGTSDCASNITGAIARPYLTSFQNGFGATTSYSYYTGSGTMWAVPFQSPCGWQRIIVQQKTVSPGGGQANEVSNYTNYGGMTYWAAPNGGGLEYVDADFHGFSSVTEENRTGSGTLLGSRACTYETATWEIGLEDNCDTKDSAGSSTRTITNTWEVVSPSTCDALCNTWEPSTVDSSLRISKFVRLDRTTDYMKGRDDLTTDYQYGSYGNMTLLCEYSTAYPGFFSGGYCTSDSSRQRKTSIIYSAAPTTGYVVATECQRDVRPDFGAAVSSVLSYYDTTAGLCAAVTRPLVTRTDRFTTVNTYIETKSYAYYGNGNLQTENTWQTPSTYDRKDYSYFTCGGATVSEVDDGGGALQTLYTYGEGLGGDDYGCLFQEPEAVTDWTNQVTTTQYDAFGRATRVWKPGDSLQSTPTISYDYSHWDAGTTSGIANGTYEYRLTTGTNTLQSATWTDGLGRVIQTRKQGLTTTGAATTIVVDDVYDGAGNRVSESMPYLPTTASLSLFYSSPQVSGSYFTLYTYDVLGRVTRVDDPDTTKGHHDTTYSGNQRTETDERTNQIVYTQDGLGRTLTVAEYTSPTAHRDVIYGYDPLDQVATINYDGTGSGIIYTYDGLGRKTQETNSSTGNWSYTYCSDGSMRTSTDPRGVIISYGYDLLGRITAKKYNNSTPDCSAALTSPDLSYTYDSAASNLSNGSGVDTGYPTGRLSKVTDSVGDHLYSYDNRGRLAYERTVTGPTTYNIKRTYDSMDRLATLRYPSSNTTYPSDSTSGELLTYSYDAQGNISTIQSSLSSTPYYLGSSTVSATSTMTGNPATLPLGSGQTVNYGYWPADQRLQSIQVGASGGLLNLSYGYDAAGNVKSITDGKILIGTELDPVNDARNRISTTTGTWNDIYLYDAAMGRMVQKASPDLAVTTWTSICYASCATSTGGPYAMKTASGVNTSYTTYTSPALQFQLTYDARGDVLQIDGDTATNPYTGSPLLRLRRTPTGTTTADAYDAEGRLQWISYDKQGSLALEMNDDSACLLGLGDASMFSSHFGHNYLKPDSTLDPQYLPRFDYNMDGRIGLGDVSKLSSLFGRNCLHLLYDYNGQLGRITGGAKGGSAGVLIDNIYERRDDGSIRKYYYDGKLLIGQRTTNADSTETLHYITQDNVGSTALITNQFGTLESRIRYTPFGEIASFDDGNPNQVIAPTAFTDRLFAGYKFFGGRLISQSGSIDGGLYYAGARFYSPELGRFMSPDPAGPNLQNPDTLDPYAYVLNNPLTLTDPSGACVYDMPRGGPGEARGCGLDRPEQAPTFTRGSSSRVDTFVCSTPRATPLPTAFALSNTLIAQGGTGPVGLSPWRYEVDAEENGTGGYMGGIIQEPGDQYIPKLYVRVYRVQGGEIGYYRTEAFVSLPSPADYYNVTTWLDQSEERQVAIRPYSGSGSDQLTASDAGYTFSTSYLPTSVSALVSPFEGAIVPPITWIIASGRIR